MAQANVFLLAWQVDIGMRHKCTNCTQKADEEIAMQLKLFAVQQILMNSKIILLYQNKCSAMKYCTKRSLVH